MTNHHAIMRLIRQVEELGFTDFRLARERMKGYAEHWGGRWYLFIVTISGREYYPVLNEAQAGLIREHAGWELVTSKLGKGVDE